MKNEKTIAVIGLGYVGLPLALLAARKKYNVIGIDKNKEKVDLIKQRISPFNDKSISKELKTTTMVASTDFDLIKKASVVIMCVPTPVFENHTPNLEPVKSASTEIGSRLQKGQLIVLESTVNPGVSEEIVLPILEKQSHLKAGTDFYISHCPERINPGDPKWNVENINRVVGSLEPTGLKLAAEFYRSILSSEVKEMGSLKEAEACKVVENSFRDINIAFVNELAMSFDQLGIDVVRVIEGAATKPFAFTAHFPGCGVGGHCIPVDPYYLIEYAQENGFEHDFLRLARKINNKMPEFTANLVVQGLNQSGLSINNTKVAVLGLSYKADIDDYRESPSFDIIKHLKKLGAYVVVYDPFVPDQSTVKTLNEAIKNSTAIVIATAHKEFKDLTAEVLSKSGVKVVIDGRNCLPKEQFKKNGILYKGIGH